MFYSNLIKSNIKYKTYDLLPFNNQMNTKDDERITKLGSCKSVYNFNCSSGALTDGVGIGEMKLMWENYFDPSYKTLELPLAFVKACYFLPYWSKNQDCYMPSFIIYTADNCFYYNTITHQSIEWEKINNLPFTEKPMALYSKINGEDCLIFYNEENGMYIWNQYVIGDNKIDNPPKIVSMCIHDNRLFATIDGEARSIIYSEELNPTNFNVGDGEGGYINMNDNFGKCNKVVSFNGYLYVFRDYNIAKVVEGKDRNQFIVNQLYVGNGRIFPKTITVCGDKIIFLATDGLYEFDGNNAKKIKINFDNMIKSSDNDFAISEFFNGMYYLACNFDFQTDESYACEKRNTLYNNALLKIDVNSYDCEIYRGIDITDFNIIKDGMNNCIVVSYAFNADQTSIGILNESGNVLGVDLKKFWKSEMFDFELPDKYKFVKEIILTTKTDIIMNVCLDDKIKSIKIKGKNSSQKIKINEKAKRVGFEFIAEASGVYISRPRVKIGVYE